MRKTSARKIQRLYREEQVLYKDMCKIENLILDYGRDDLDDECDKAYSRYWKKREELVQELMKVCKIERQTANRMMATDKFVSLMNMTIID